MRIDRRAILAACLAAAAPALPARADDPTAAALRDAGMHDVLEAHLLHRLQDADDTQRPTLTDRLADLYAERLRTLPPTDPARAGVVRRAWALADAVGEQRAVELRLTLLLDEYLPIERAAELHELGLLSEPDRAQHAERLTELHARFRAMARAAVVNASAALRGSADGPDATGPAYRQRSLANYYAAWSGLSLAVLENRPPSPDVLTSFGWLLGAEGDLPRLDAVAPSTLELEHVARAAIGVGRARSLTQDWLLAEQWLRMVVEADRAPEAVRTQGFGRLIRLHADRQDWPGVLELTETLRAARQASGPVLTAPDARYVAMRALAPDTREAPDARSVASAALADLIARGEIGHVLDLRDRFGASGLLGEGFVAHYAAGLDLLDAAQRHDNPLQYAQAAARLLAAADAEDAGRFPLPRDDARLKAAFAEIRAGQPRKAAAIAQSVLDAAPSDEAAEEALWLVIVALDETLDERLHDELGDRVREYLARHPGTARASQLLVRHAGTDLLEPSAAADGLRAVAEDDPVVLRARRTLARLVYRVWIDSRRLDAAARSELLELVNGVWSLEPRAPEPGLARERLDTARIALDAALGAPPVDLDTAARALERARAAVRADSSLARFGQELDLRAVEIHAARGELDAAAAVADALRLAASHHAPAADRVVLRAVLDRLDADPDDRAAGRIGVRIGTRLSAELIPPAPAPVSPESSLVLDRVWRLIAAESAAADDPAAASVALRIARVVLDRGRPTAQGLREMADLARRTGDAESELDAWSALLGASRDDEPVWWESRYHTLRLLLDRDPEAARRAYEQHRVLHPMPGPLPWTTRIDDLFRENDPGTAPAEEDAP